MTTAVAAPFRFFSLQVVRTRRLGPSMTRVTLGGAELSAFLSGGRDQCLSLFLPRPGQPEPVVPVEAGDGWWEAWRGMPDDVRGVMRYYTVREQRHGHDEAPEIDIDFVLHGLTAADTAETADTADAAESAGPAARWAAGAGPGDRVLVLGPAVADNTGVRFRPPTDTDLVILWADETALPAAAGILESLPSGLRVHAWLEVQHGGDRQELATKADARITWLVRDEGAPTALEALRAAGLPEAGSPGAAAPYAWIAGESGSVKALRRHLVDERGLDRRRIAFVGYWRRGLSEEELRLRAQED